jgi:hypothetical protein
MKWLANITALAALAANNPLQAQTWQTVLDYPNPHVSGKNAEGWAMAADASGNVFSGGESDDVSGIQHGIVLKTDTTELAKIDPLTVNWDFSDDTNPFATQLSTFRGLACGAGGKVYSGGSSKPNCSGRNCAGSSWLVRRSLAAGAPGSWTSLDSFQLVAGKSASAKAIVEDSSGNILVAGTATDKAERAHWVIRKSANGGQTWAVVDDLQDSFAQGIHLSPDPDTGGDRIFAVGGFPSFWRVRRSDNGGVIWTTVDQPFEGVAWGAGSDSDGYVYAVGEGAKSVRIGKTSIFYNEWTVRRWRNGDSQWATVDAFTMAQYKSATARAIAKDSIGKTVVVGSAWDAQGIIHWIVRRPDSSGTFQIVDDYQFPQGQGAEALGVVVDATGNVLVSGAGYDATGIAHWIVRRLATL